MAIETSEPMAVVRSRSELFDEHRDAGFRGILHGVPQGGDVRRHRPIIQALGGGATDDEPVDSSAVVAALRAAGDLTVPSGLTAAMPGIAAGIAEHPLGEINIGQDRLVAHPPNCRAGA